MKEGRGSRARRGKHRKGSDEACKPGWNEDKDSIHSQTRVTISFAGQVRGCVFLADRITVLILAGQEEARRSREEDDQSLSEPILVFLIAVVHKSYTPIAVWFPSYQLGGWLGVPTFLDNPNCSWTIIRKMNYVFFFDYFYPLLPCCSLMIYW